MLWPARATRFLPVRPHSVFPSVVVQLLLLQGGSVSKLLRFVLPIFSQTQFSYFGHLIEHCLCAFLIEHCL